MAAPSGLIAVTKKTPRNAAVRITGVRNCQIEIPEARATTSSLVRVSRQNVYMAPNRTANGTIFSMAWGSFSSASRSTRANVTASLVLLRRNSSTTSTRKMIAPSEASTSAKPPRKRRAVYSDSVSEILVAPAMARVKPGPRVRGRAFFGGLRGPAARGSR